MDITQKVKIPQTAHPLAVGQNSAKAADFNPPLKSVGIIAAQPANVAAIRALHAVNKEKARLGAIEIQRAEAAKAAAAAAAVRATQDTRRGEAVLAAHVATVSLVNSR